MRKSDALLRILLSIAGLTFALGGVWAYFWPSGFYATIATYPPFNLHLFHDVGAFQLGLAAFTFGCVFGRDVLLVGLFGASVGTVAHFVSHLVDRDLGGSASDPYTTAGIALVAVAGLVIRLAARRSGRESR